MQITLPDDLARFVKSEMANGNYPNVSAMVFDALRELRAGRLNSEVDSQELEDWLLEAEGSPETPYSKDDLNGIREKIVREPNSG
jgi:putative addiction module CopG family antidote